MIVNSLGEYAGPLVTVVMSTYNRSNLLPHVIGSLQRQTFTDWELIVVGDACTDDTEALVAAIADRDGRIRFVSMGRNFGEQSGPNTVGALLGRGELIAYLNHDDLWAPWHLESAVAALTRSGADVTVASLAWLLTQMDSGRPAEVKVVGPAGGERYDVSTFVPASAWLCRREVVETLGGWRPARRLLVESSHDFLHRALHAGFLILGTGVTSVIAVPSGARERAYAERAELEHRHLAVRLAADPHELVAELEAAARRRDEAIQSRRVAGLGGRTRSLIGRASRAYIYPAVNRIGVNPRAVRAWLAGRRSGDQIRALRQRRGLPRIFEE